MNPLPLILKSLHLIFLALCIVFSPLSGCYAKKRETLNSSQDIPQVLVTLAPYAFLAKQLGGKTIHVETIIPAGMNAHIYEPTPHLLQKKIAIWFRTGELFEKKLLQSIEDKHLHTKIINLQEGLPLLSAHDLIALGGCHEHHAHEQTEADLYDKDLHTWTSPKLFIQQAIMIAETLAIVFPEHEKQYRENLKVLLDDLNSLDQNIKNLLAPHQGEAFLISHPSLGYFCREYGLYQLSVECEGKDPLPQDVSSLLKEIKRYHTRVAFVQKGFNNQGTTLIATRLKLPIYMIDPYAENYLENLWEIAKAFEK